jgi:serine/threonine protein kinase
MQIKRGTLLYRDSYRIIKTIGRGGFGITYLAEQVMTKRKVCIKEFFPKGFYKRDEGLNSVSLLSKDFAERMGRFKSKFMKEAQTIARLDHQNIVHVFDAFEENGTVYYVMEYIEGESLNDVVKRRGALVESEAVEFIRTVARAISYLHEQHIMHLDIKPANIVVRSRDNQPVLIDFGLSKHYDKQSGDATSTTPVGYSDGYAPIEQYQNGGVSSFSPETDIYSLGATLYYLVTGNVPPQAIVIVAEGLPELPKHISKSVCNVIMGAMAEKPRHRFHSIGEFLSKLDSCNVESLSTSTINQVEDTIIDISNSSSKRSESTVIDVTNSSQGDKTSFDKGGFVTQYSEEKKVQPKRVKTDKPASAQKSAKISEQNSEELSHKYKDSIISKMLSQIFFYESSIPLNFGFVLVSAWLVQLLLEWGIIWSILGPILLIGVSFSIYSRVMPLINNLCWAFILIDLLCFNCTCLDELIFPILALFK